MATEATIVVDTSIHELDALKSLCYALGDQCSARLERLDESRVNVICRAQADGELPPDFALTFESRLIDHGIRVRLNRETAVVRDLIFRQAFVEADL